MFNAKMTLQKQCSITCLSHFKVKCTKFDFRLGCPPDPAGGAFSAPRDPLAVFKGPVSNEKNGNGDKMGRKGSIEGGAREKCEA